MKFEPSRLRPIWTKCSSCWQRSLNSPNASWLAISAEAEGITPLIVLNKSDLGTLFDHAWARLQPYRDMGYTFCRCA